MWNTNNRVAAQFKRRDFLNSLFQQRCKRKYSLCKTEEFVGFFIAKTLFFSFFQAFNKKMKSSQAYNFKSKMITNVKSEIIQNFKFEF